MPIYEYRCAHCDTTFESLSMPSEARHGGTICPKCGTIGAERIPSTFGNYKIKGDNSASTRPIKGK